jgi:hypothetical protein
LHKEGPLYGVIVISSIKEKLFLEVQRHVEVLAGGEEVEVDGRRMLEGQCWGRTSLGYIIN